MCETFFPLATVFVVGLGETLWLSRERTANRALGRVAILSVAGGKKKPDLLSKVGLSGELILPGSVVGGTGFEPGYERCEVPCSSAENAGDALSSG